MIDNKGNIRFLNNDTVLLLLIVVAGLLIFSTSFNRSVKTITNTQSVAVSLNQKSGDIAPEIRFNVIQKTLVSGNDKFKLLSLTRQADIINNKSVQYISFSKNCRRETVFIPGLIFHYHLFPAEKGDDPFLS